MSDFYEEDEDANVIFGAWRRFSDKGRTGPPDEAPRLPPRGIFARTEHLTDLDCPVCGIERPSRDPPCPHCGSNQPASPPPDEPDRTDSPEQPEQRGDTAMATRQSEAAEVIARCKKVGWTVRRHTASGGYKVYPPNSVPITVHLTPSDVNGFKNTVKTLENAGLIEAEEQYEETRAANKAAELERQRRLADQQAAKLATRSKRLASAAGPYASPEKIPLDWFLNAHPAPWMRWALVSPELASTVLSRLNTDNRPLNMNRVDHWERVIVSGQWHLTHQGMAIDTTPVLQDGQHRLMAIERAGLEVPVAFFVGMPPENFKAIDEGLLRTAGQLFGKDGEKYTSTLSGLVRLVESFGAPNPRAYSRMALTNESVYDRFQTDAEEMRAAAAWGYSVFKKIGATASACAAMRYLLRRNNGPENPYVAVYLEGLASGKIGETRIMLPEDDPRMAVRFLFRRQKDLKMKLPGLDQLAYMVKSWNYVVDDMRVKHFRNEHLTAIPHIRMCLHEGPTASAVPPLLADELRVYLEGQEIAAQIERDEAGLLGELGDAA